jgi:hypothetical protein
MSTYKINCWYFHFQNFYISSSTQTTFLRIHEGRPKSKNRLRIALVQVNTPRRFKVAQPQSSVSFVPSKFSSDCII